MKASNTKVMSILYIGWYYMPFITNLEGVVSVAGSHVTPAPLNAMETPKKGVNIFHVMFMLRAAPQNVSRGAMGALLLRHPGAQPPS